MITAQTSRALAVMIQRVPSSPNPLAVAVAVAPDGRLREIVDAAAELFDKHGYDRVSMEDIADGVGLAKPSLYHYVRGKDEILVHIHAEFMGLVFQKADARLNIALSPREEVIETMADILGLMQTHRGHVRVFFEHHRELPARARKSITEQRDRYEARVREAVDRGIATGDFRKLDARLATLALFGMCNWAYQWYERGGPLTPRQIAEQFGSFFVEGIRAAP
jgi:AcrR family transcriptional regulator